MSDVADLEDADALEAREAEQERQRLAAERRDRIACEDLERIMSTPHGRRFMWSLLEDCHTMHVSFRHGEPMESAVFREGERNIGVKLVGRINRTCPDLYASMVREAMNTED